MKQPSLFLVINIVLIMHLATFHFLIEPTPVNLNATATDIALRTVNISWNLVQGDAMWVYTLTLASIRDFHTPLSIRAPFEFTGPEGAPPCEVYNFSVTATYVGATYTGAGCSVGASHINNRMLPSLPNIDMLDISLN